MVLLFSTPFPAVWRQSGHSGPNLLSSKMVQHMGLLDCGGSKRIRWVQWKLLRWWWWPPLSEGWSWGLKLKGVRTGWLCVGAWCGVCVWGCLEGYLLLDCWKRQFRTSPRSWAGAWGVSNCLVSSVSEAGLVPSPVPGRGNKGSEQRGTGSRSCCVLGPDLDSGTRPQSVPCRPPNLCLQSLKLGPPSRPRANWVRSVIIHLQITHVGVHSESFLLNVRNFEIKK